MKIAVCLSGHTRTYLDTYKSQFDHIVNGIDGEVDFFIHTYNTNGFKDKVGSNTSDESILLTIEEVKNVLNIYNPKYILIEDNKEIIQKSNPHKWDNRDRVQPETSVHSVLSMFYSIKKSNELKNKYEEKNNLEYDVVFRLRFDDLIKRQEFDFSKVEDGFIYVPTIDGLGYSAKNNNDQHGWSWRGGLSDQLVFGNKRAMNTFSGVYDNIVRLYDSGTWFHPETMARALIEERGILPWLVDDIEYDLFRGSP